MQILWIYVGNIALQYQNSYCYITLCAIYHTSLWESINITTVNFYKHSLSSLDFFPGKQQIGLHVLGCTSIHTKHILSLSLSDLKVGDTANKLLLWGINVHYQSSWHWSFCAVKMWLKHLLYALSDIPTYKTKLNPTSSGRDIIRHPSKYQHRFEKWYMHLIVNCPRNSKMALPFK